MARRPSLSMLILQTAERAARRNCSSEMPTAASILPPNRLIISTYSGMTLEAPCSTMGNPGRRCSISSRISNLRGGGSSPGFTLNLKAPWDVPMEMAKESTPVCSTNSSTSRQFLPASKNLARPPRPPPPPPRHRRRLRRRRRGNSRRHRPKAGKHWGWVGAGSADTGAGEILGPHLTPLPGSIVPI